MGHSIRESDGESFEDHGNGQDMTAASGPSTPLPFSLSFATPVTCHQKTFSVEFIPDLLRFSYDRGPAILEYIK